MLLVLLSLAEKIVDDYVALIPRRKPDMERIEQALLIAHRGAHNNRQGIFENSLEAFRLAKKAGCWGLELDVHATADKILVVNHDSNLKRLWNHNVVIADVTFNELRMLAPGVPSLVEVIEEFGGQMHLFIELKAPFQDKNVLTQNLHHLSPCEDYHLLSLDPLIFNELSNFPATSLLLVAVHNNVKAFCELSIKKHYGGVLGNHLLLTRRYIRQLNEAQQASGVGFVNSRNSLYRELNKGVKWLFTNQAIELNHYLQELYLPV